MNQIRDAMKKAEISVQPTSARSVKQQFLDCVKVIQQKRILEIQRAKMELAIVLPSFENNNGENNADEELRVEREELQESIIALLQNEAGAIIEEIVHLQRVLFLIDPSAYRVVDGIAKEFVGVKLEILRQTVTQEGDVDVSLELERNTMLQQQSSSRNDQRNVSQLQTLQEYDSNAGLHNDFANMSMGNNQNKYNINDKYHNENDNDDDDDDEYEAAVAVSSRKKNKKAAKKSKKQKRREKEEASMRQERIEAEKARQEERNIRLGLNSSSNSVGVGIGDSDMNGACTPCTNANDCRGLNDASNDGAKKSCNTCGGSFTVKEYRAHFRSDWHRYNQKLKMKGVAPIDEKEFLLIDSDAFFTDGMM